MSLELSILNSLRVSPFDGACERGSVSCQRYLSVQMALQKTTFLDQRYLRWSHLAFCLIREQSRLAGIISRALLRRLGVLESPSFGVL